MNYNPTDTSITRTDDGVPCTFAGTGKDTQVIVNANNVETPAPRSVEVEGRTFYLSHTDVALNRYHYTPTKPAEATPGKTAALFALAG